MKRMNILYKMSIAALLIAIATILSRFLSIPYMFGLPFLKLSFAPSIVTFASFYLGPIFGLIVGLGSDLIGALAFPQGEFNILFSISPSLGGLMPYLIYRFVKWTKTENKFPTFLVGSLALFSIGITLFFALNDTISYTSSSRVYVFEPRLKATIISLVRALSIGYVVGIYFIKRFYKNGKVNNNYNIYMISSSTFLTYFLFKIPVISLVFMIVMNYDFMIVFGTRLLYGFFSSFVDIIVSIIALNISLRFAYKGPLVNSEIGVTKYGR